MATEHSCWPAYVGSLWWFLFIECFHIFGIVELVDATRIRDLRLQPLTLLPGSERQWCFLTPVLLETEIPVSISFVSLGGTDAN